MAFSLDVFPVLRPTNFLPQLTPHPRREGDECPTDIRYNDDFDGRRRGGRSHNAIDIFGSIGLWVVAATDGTVATTWIYEGDPRPGAGNSTDGGNFVRMIDTNGNVHYYAHMDKSPRVEPGETVTAGQLLGYLGRTGLAATTCPHLHYQVRRPSPWNPGRGGGPINPYRELRRVQEITAVI